MTCRLPRFRAPRSPEIEAFRKRMGWRFPMGVLERQRFQLRLSSCRSTRNEIAGDKVYYNYALTEIDSDELPGLSVFYKDEKGDVFHTYSTYARGGELLAGAYSFLDLTPRGRNETGPGFNLTDWVRHCMTVYGEGGHVDATGRYVPLENSCCGSEQAATIDDARRRG